MDPDSLVRITEFTHALKIFIAAAKRLKDEDMEHLDKINAEYHGCNENP